MSPIRIRLWYSIVDDCDCWTSLKLDGMDGIPPYFPGIRKTMMQISGPDLYDSPYWKVTKVARVRARGYFGHLEFVPQCRAMKSGL